MCMYRYVYVKDIVSLRIGSTIVLSPPRSCRATTPTITMYIVLYDNLILRWVASIDGKPTNTEHVLEYITCFGYLI